MTRRCPRKPAARLLPSLPASHLPLECKADRCESAEHHLAPQGAPLALLALRDQLPVKWVTHIRYHIFIIVSSATESLHRVKPDVGGFGHLAL